MGVRAYRVLITGIVQGVGFRPFIYRLASELRLGGYVRNVGGSEVEVYVEGSDEELMKFIELIKERAPKAARIEELVVNVVEPLGIKDFRILPSGSEAIKYSMIPPDIGICDDCLREVLDPSNRRYRYPFNSCVWCGPRYSMMYKPPYDRANTSMNDFPLCDDCLNEYSDPRNIRRFHAQGISCPKCGPRLHLYSRDGELISAEDPIGLTSKLINEGHIVAIKGLGGYHIAALASDDDVVLRLRARKARPQKPFAVMALDEVVVNKLCYVDGYAVELLKSPERPIVLLPKREDSPVSKYVSPGLDVEGVFLPYTALHHLLIRGVKDGFAIMTSGNPRGKPMCIDEECAFKLLKDYVDYFLIHDRVIVNRVDDSVIRFTNGRPVLIRRGRGYAPMWIRVRFKFRRPVIAFGAELQSAGAVAFDDKVVLTQYIGDADDYDVLVDLDKYLRFFINVYNVDVSRSYLVVDKHPRYNSRLLANQYLSNYGGELIEVQHHYAHALATAADLGLSPDDEFIAVVLDGVGYGDDGNIWGGEVLRCSFRGYSRLGHLEYVPLPDDSFVTYPHRMLISYLYKLLSDSDSVLATIRRLGLNKLFRYGDIEVSATLRKVIRASTYTSSTGRFLDSISALLGICVERTYEGEPAIKLEAAAKGGKLIDIDDDFIGGQDGMYIVLTTKILNHVLEKLNHGSSSIAYTVQYLLGRSLGEIVVKALYGSRISTVILSGGAVVNSVIVKGLVDLLSGYGVDAHLPGRVPPNDGGIALGQAVSTYNYFIAD